MTEHIDKIEAIAEAAADYLFVEKRPPLYLPYHLTVKFPDCAPLDLTLCIATIADLAETQLAMTSVADVAAPLWRIASLVAVDVLVMQTMGLPCLTAVNLRTYWIDHDHYFLPVAMETRANSGRDT